jgi:hypothetical protein
LITLQIYIISERIQNEYQLNKLLGDPSTPKISNLEKQIYRKFWFLKVQTYCKPEILNLDSHYYNRIYKRNFAIDLELDYYIRFLSLVDYDTAYISQRAELLEKREFSLKRRFALEKQVDLNDVNYNLIQSIKLAYEKEIL